MDHRIESGGRRGHVRAKPMVSRALSLVTLVVPDYDSAISYFVSTLGFTLVEDTPLSEDKRWVVVSPSTDAETKILLAKAMTQIQKDRIGSQTGDRVGLFLQTDDFDRDYVAFLASGVHFLEEPRQEAYGKVVVFEDEFGNKWDLIQYSN